MPTLYPKLGELEAPVLSAQAKPNTEPIVDTTQTVANIKAGEATANSMLALLAAGNHSTLGAAIGEQVQFWQAQVALDPDNGDTQGTLGYFAVSALDFWQAEQEITDALNTWAWYSREQAGKPFAEMQPIDLWFEAKKNA